MSAIVVGLNLASTADAVKKNQKEVESGPMDRYVTRSYGPKLVATKKTKKVKASTKIRKSYILPAEEAAERSKQEAYILGRLGYIQGLTPIQKAWLTKF